MITTEIFLELAPDPLGRQFKTEVLNENGSVCSTSANIYNAGDLLAVHFIRERDDFAAHAAHRDSEAVFEPIDVFVFR